MLCSFHRTCRLALAAACLLGMPVRAQDDAGSRRAAIEGMYPVMLGALEAGNFGRARNICEQAIMWEPQNPVHHYNLACIESQAGGARLPYAWGALELAVALGFDDTEHFLNDPDLAPLRRDPRFNDLLRKMIYDPSAGVTGASLPATDSPRSPPGAGETEVEAPAPAAFHDDLPVGLYLLSRYDAPSQRLEESVWYFAPDRSVHRDLEEGFSQADLAALEGPRGTASRVDRRLEITWTDGAKSVSGLERDGLGFTWNMGIFVPLVAFDNPGDVAGIYEGGKPAASGGTELPVAQRLTLRLDGTFRWEGVSFTGDTPSIHASPAHQAVTTGRWVLSGLSLILTNDDGVALRRIAVPLDDDVTVIKPDRMFFSGLTYKRRP